MQADDGVLPSRVHLPRIILHAPTPPIRQADEGVLTSLVHRVHRLTAPKGVAPFRHPTTWGVRGGRPPQSAAQALAPRA